jgi:hypothetical protein
MPHPKIHERIDLEVFGKAYPEVHKWIDGAFDGTNGRTHWIDRHFRTAILEHFIDNPDKDHLIQVAMLHVIVDWLYYYKRIVFPQIREDVIRELRSEGVFIDA